MNAERRPSQGRGGGGNGNRGGEGAGRRGGNRMRPNLPTSEGILGSTPMAPNRGALAPWHVESTETNSTVADSSCSWLTQDASSVGSNSRDNSIESRDTGDVYFADQVIVDACLALSACVLVFACLTLLACRSPTCPLYTHFRTLRMADLLIGVYGAAKMVLVQRACVLKINFFLPDSFLITAGLVSGLTLLVMHVTMYLKLAWPEKFAKVYERTTMTLTMIVWNVALVTGFVPLLVVHSTFTLNFHEFYWEPYLLTTNLVQFVAISTSLVLALLSKRLQIPMAQKAIVSSYSGIAPFTGQDMTPREGEEGVGGSSSTLSSTTTTTTITTTQHICRSSLQGLVVPSIAGRRYGSRKLTEAATVRLLGISFLSKRGTSTGDSYNSDGSSADVEAATPRVADISPTPRWIVPAQKVKGLVQFHRWATIESCVTFTFYLPFLVYVVLTCSVCPLGGWKGRDKSVIYFAPVYTMKALITSWLHMYMKRKLGKLLVQRVGKQQEKPEQQDTVSQSAEVSPSVNATGQSSISSCNNSSSIPQTPQSSNVTEEELGQPLSAEDNLFNIVDQSHRCQPSLEGNNNQHGHHSSWTMQKEHSLKTPSHEKIQLHDQPLLHNPIQNNQHISLQLNSPNTERDKNVPEPDVGNSAASFQWNYSLSVAGEFNQACYSNMAFDATGDIIETEVEVELTSL